VAEKKSGACRRVTAHRIFKRRVRARSVLKAAVFCAVESRILTLISDCAVLDVYAMILTCYPNINLRGGVI
jgi:hypothetical protein